jgi:hypothetical protein
MVTFSPEVLRCFSHIENAVRGSDQFPFEIQENLQDYARGEPIQVLRAINAIAYIARETTKYIEKTADAKANEALTKLFEALSSDEKRPVRISKAVSKSL